MPSRTYSRDVKKLLLALLIALAPEPRIEASSRRTPVVEAVEKAMPSVVNIGTERIVRRVYSDPRMRSRGDMMDMMLREFFGAPIERPTYQSSQSLGSGVIVTSSGYILTNHHVIERASVIRVTLSDETTYEARVITGDEINDLALIKIDADKPLPAIPFAGDDDLLLGETVIALGNPFGLAHTVTSGILSGKNREAYFRGEVLYRDILQTDAAVNPGNSGGPLVNIDGNLIGINVAIFHDKQQTAQNIGFAVPVKRARALLTRWLTPRLIYNRWPGFDMETSSEGQIKVSRIDTNSAAHAAGIRIGDEIAGLNGVAYPDLYSMNRELLMVEPGGPVSIDVRLGGEVRSIPLTMTAVPKPSGDELARLHLGITFKGDKDGDRQISRGHLQIEAIEAGSPADLAGLRPGMIISRINNVEAKSIEDIGIALENIEAGQPVRTEVTVMTEFDSHILAQTTVLDLIAN